jgi:alpha-tubulin suppressor-like RCC1 family protein
VLNADRTSLGCFGRNTSGEAGLGTTNPTETFGNVLVGAPISVLDVGERHACAIADELQCWGDGTDGQLGLGAATTTALSPTPVPAVTGAIGVVTGFAHTCAWTPTDFRCWGRNDRGQLGDGTLDSRFDPGDPLPRVSPVVHAAGGDGHSCAVRDDGTLFCWGDNTSGQLGDGGVDSHLEPTRALVSDVVEVVTGRAHTCALRRDRQVRCWGDDAYGQLGDGESGVVSRVVAPEGLGPVVQITAGADHTCVREEDGTVQCFGAGAEGQLGSPPSSPEGFSSSPAPAALGGAVTEIRAGHHYTCARLDDMTGWCFGANDDGQFGEPSAGGATPFAASALGLM